MDRIYNSLTRSRDGMEVTEPPIVMPRPVAGLVSKRVLVMDYLEGVPLSRAREEMEKKGIQVLWQKTFEGAYVCLRSEYFGNRFLPCR